MGVHYQFCYVSYLFWAFPGGRQASPHPPRPVLRTPTFTCQQSINSLHEDINYDLVNQSTWHMTKQFIRLSDVKQINGDIMRNIWKMNSK